jgi:hypothetical protein
MTTTTLVLQSDDPRSMTYLQSIFKWESVVFAVICLADMFSTLHWVHQGTASEENPWLASYLQQGDMQFIAIKLLSFVPMLCFAAWYRMQQPKFIAVALRIGIAAYVLIYVVNIGMQIGR